MRTKQMRVPLELVAQLSAIAEQRRRQRGILIDWSGVAREMIEVGLRVTVVSDALGDTCDDSQKKVS